METLAGRVGVTPVEARKSLDLMAEALSAQGPGSDHLAHVVDVLGAQEARDADRRSPAGLGLLLGPHLLRLPKDDISRVRQLSEIGLDSLMGVELGASLQEIRRRGAGRG
jgi:phthiocerol/phenolphthiocerol synthesis type-I polyketide synthase C